MSAPFTAAMLALSPDSFWLCGDAGSTLVDSVGGKDLTIRGTPNAQGFAVGAPYIGVDPGINFGNAIDTSYALITTPLTQIASNKFSVVGFFRDTVYPSIFVMPYFCASFSGGHTDPYYIFGYFLSGSSSVRAPIDTTGTFVPNDTGASFPINNAWHLIGMTYDGTTLSLWENNVAFTSGAVTGNLANNMGSFALNNIPALDDVSFAGATQCASVGYWHDRTISAAEMGVLYTAAQTAPPTQPQVLLPGSVSAALRV